MWLLSAIAVAVTATVVGAAVAAIRLHTAL